MTPTVPPNTPRPRKRLPVSVTPTLALLVVTGTLTAATALTLLHSGRVAGEAQGSGWLLTLTTISFALLLWAIGRVGRDAAASAEWESQNRELRLRQEELGAQQDQLEATTQELAVANARLEYASHRFEELYQSLPVPCVCYDESGRVFEWNRAFEACYGLAASEIFQKSIWEVTATPAEAPPLQAVVAGIFSGEIPDGWEQNWTLPDGATRHLLIHAFPLRDQNERITGGINAALDITERRRAEEKYRAIFENAIEGIFQVSSVGAVLSVNPAMARMLGYDSPDEFVTLCGDIPAHLYVRPDDRALMASVLEQYDTVSALEIEMRRKDGSPLWVAVNAHVQRGPDGAVLYYEGTLEDVSARKQMEEALRASAERLRAFHVITADTELSAPQKMQQMLHLGCREFGMSVGVIAEIDVQEYRIHWSVAPDGAYPANLLCSRAETFCGEAVRQGVALAIPDVGGTEWRLHPAYTRFRAGAYLGVPLRVGGLDWGALCFTAPTPRAPFTDSEQDFLRLMAQWAGGEVERQQAQQAIQESEERFRSAIESMQEGFMVQDRDGVVLLCNQSAERILSVPAADLLHHPAVRPEWRFLRTDGAEFPRAEHPSRRAIATGRPQQDVILGMENRTSGKVFWTSMNAAPLYHSGADAPYAAVLTFTDITGRRLQEAQIAAHLEQIKDYTIVLEYQKQELEAQKRTLERTNMRLEVANVALESLATLDGLTSLKNHRVFQERLESEIVRSRRYGLPLSLILLDVDHFKQYNDAYGHPAGDEVLKIVGRILEESARETDMVARYGGEEFAMILPNTSGEAASVVAERLRLCLTEHEWPLRAITASLGVSSLSPAMVERAAFITDADVALYRAKAGGRNRVARSSDPLSSALAAALAA